MRGGVSGGSGNVREGRSFRIGNGWEFVGHIGWMSTVWQKDTKSQVYERAAHDDNNKLDFR